MEAFELVSNVFVFLSLSQYHSLFVTDNSCTYFLCFKGVGGVGRMIIA